MKELKAGKKLSKTLDDLYESYIELEDLFMGFVRSMVHALDAKSQWTRGHSERVATYAQELAREIGYKEEEIKELTLAALLRYCQVFSANSLKGSILNGFHGS
ncbi:MAG: hypothetical protein AB1610_00860 [Nitrospirota bacterium]